MKYLLKIIPTVLLTVLLVGLGAPLAQAQAGPTQSGATLDTVAPAQQGPTQSGATVDTTLANPSSLTGGNINQAGGDDIGCSYSTVTGGNGVTPGMGVAICVSNLVYYTMVGLGSWAANIAAYLFDYSVYITLNSAAYALDFIAIGWGIARDVVNMAFLFILVYIGFKIILAAETAGTIRLLVGVVVVALLVNFSFLMTRFVIDAGNILAVQFYNTIAATAPAINNQGATAGNATTLNNPSAQNTIGGIPVKDITSSIMSALNPQALIGSTGAGVGSFKSFVANPTNSAMYYLIVSSVIFILTGFALWMLAMTFVFVSVKFIMRVVGLWGIIILAPVAFVAAIFRGSKEGWGKWFDLWLGYLIKFSFYPAVFLFMFYIQTRFMIEMNTAQLFNNVLNATDAANASWTQIVSAAANVSVRLGFILATLYLTLHVADWTVKEFSQATGWLRGKLSGPTRTALRWGGRGLGYAGATAAQPVRRGIQSQYEAAERSNVNRTLWRGINRAAGGTILTREQVSAQQQGQGRGARTAIQGLYAAKKIEDTKAADKAVAGRLSDKRAAQGLFRAAQRESEARAKAAGSLYQAKVDEDIANRLANQKAVGGLYRGAERESETRAKAVGGLYAAKTNEDIGVATSGRFILEDCSGRYVGQLNG